jgi:hypothetical protein
MAKAPTPKKGGYDAAKERQERARQTFRVTVKDSDISFVYRPYGLPIRVRGHVREVTGKTVDLLLWGTEGVDVATYVDLWWISRLCDDELGADGHLISRAAVQAEFDERCPGATLADIEDVDITAEVDDSPEA